MADEYLEKMGEKHWLLIKEEIGATRETLANDAKKLVEWIDKQPHLPKVTDEIWLSHMLVFAKNSIERTKENIETYFVTRAFLPDIYTNRDPSSKKLREAYEASPFFLLPKLTEEGSRIVVSHIFNSSAIQTVQNEDILKMIFVSADLHLLLSEARNVIFIFDWDGCNHNHVSALLSCIKQFVTAGTKGLPVRQKAVYLLHVPTYAETVISLGKSLVKKELANRIRVLKNGITELSEMISKDVLPIEYGGKTFTLRECKDRWYELMKEHEQWYKEQDSFKADLEMISATSNHRKDFDLEGSFRKIEID